LTIVLECRRKGGSNWKSHGMKGFLICLTPSWRFV
jgi:hypothetical protein